ncbi:MAG TPA: molybdopterin-synthase adenylyltransferase MoeB [Pantanalinema sp.]
MHHSEVDGALSREEQERYSRHLALGEVGVRGQELLKEAKVAVIGAGGLGSPIAAYLAAAGVGTIGLVDFDEVSLSNLQRQILYDTAGVGRPKVHQAKARLQAMNPHVRVVPHETALSGENAMELLAGYDWVADATDDFGTRYLLNDACRLLGKPLVHASLHRFEGQVTVFAPGGPCYRCLYPVPPAVAMRCSDAGVLGALPGILGAIQAGEILKLILGIGVPLVGRLLLVDGLGTRFDEVALEADPGCALCGERPTLSAVSDTEERRFPEWEISPREVDEVLGRALVIDVRESLAALPMLPGARHVPFARLGEALPEVPSDRPVVVCCTSGELSLKAVALLRGAGCEQAVSLEGGLLAYFRQRA